MCIILKCRAGRVLERGLAADGRLVRFEAVVSDRPGGIAALTGLLAKAGVSVKDILHERPWVDTDISSVRVKVIVETADRASARAMFELLSANGYDIEVPKITGTGSETPAVVLTGTPGAARRDIDASGGASASQQQAQQHSKVEARIITSQ